MGSGYPQPVMEQLAYPSHTGLGVARPEDRLLLCNSRGILGRFFVAFIDYQHFLTPLVWVGAGGELEP